VGISGGRSRDPKNSPPLSQGKEGEKIKKLEGNRTRVQISGIEGGQLGGPDQGERRRSNPLEGKEGNEFMYTRMGGGGGGASGD